MTPDEARSRSRIGSRGGLVVGVSGWAWKGQWLKIFVCLLLLGVDQCLDEPIDPYSLGLDARTSNHGSSTIEDCWRPPDDLRDVSPEDASPPSIEESFRPPLDSSPASSEQQLDDTQTTPVVAPSIEESYGFRLQEISNTSSTDPFPVPQSGVSDPRPSGREHGTNNNDTIQPSNNQRKKKNGWFCGCGLEQVVTSKGRRSRDS